MNNILHFDHEPSFAEIWGATTRVLYDEQLFTEELESLIHKYKPNRKMVADVAAGDGFPSLSLRKRGLDIDCFDLSTDQIQAFKENAVKYGVDSSITQASWLDIPKVIEPKKYDFVMCRGNSFIYSPGGWNSKDYNINNPLDSFRNTLKAFHSLLTHDGVLYIDKFKDSERDHHTKVCKINIMGNNYDLIFHTQVNPTTKERYASMLLGNESGEKESLPNVTYALSEPELMSLAKEAGFTKLEKICLKNDKMFDIYLLHK